jgi:hypothetical protein
MGRLSRLAAAVLVAAFVLLPPPAMARVNAGTPSAVELQEPGRGSHLRIGMLCDRTTGDDSGLLVLEQAIAEMNLLRPDFVLHIGDLVPGYTRDMERWQADVERVEVILDQLDAPLFPVAGNHDVITGTGNPADRRGEALYTDHFGPLYYSFDCGDAHFVCLYTEETLESDPKISPEQKAWLREDLEATAARNVFVLMHKPLWEYEDSGWDEVHDLLARHPVRAVFAGHFHHYYKSVERDGIQYYVLGVTGGRTFSPELAGGLEHYCLLDVDADGYSLALVRPGGILSDDYIVSADYKAMEALRFLPEADTGVAASFPSPEAGPVSGQIAVGVTNPLDVALPVVVRGPGRQGDWKFAPDSVSMVVGPGARRTAFLGLSSLQTPAARVSVPFVEVQYTYTDSRGRTVPIVLPRRVPLARRCSLPLSNEAVSLDGLAQEAFWQRSPVLPTALYYVSPFETGEAGPTFRLAATHAGLYFYARSNDAYASGFRGARMLSDAIFVGAVPISQAAGIDDLSDVPVVVVYPFSEGGPAAERAFWDPRAPAGVPVQGVHAAAHRLPDGRGWECEGFVPWGLLLGSPSLQPGPVLFNIGAWDNDGELFTDLHSWAPTASAAQWGTLTLKADQ